MIISAAESIVDIGELDCRPIVRLIKIMTLSLAKDEHELALSLILICNAAINGIEENIAPIYLRRGFQVCSFKLLIFLLLNGITIILNFIRLVSVGYRIKRDRIQHPWNSSKIWLEWHLRFQISSDVLATNFRLIFRQLFIFWGANWISYLPLLIERVHICSWVIKAIPNQRKLEYRLRSPERTPSGAHNFLRKYYFDGDSNRISLRNWIKKPKKLQEEGLNCSVIWLFAWVSE